MQTPSPRLLLLGCLPLLLAWPVAMAQVDADAEPATPAAPAAPAAIGEQAEYGGVVTNQTITALGNLFHARFAERWSNLSDSNAYVLSVGERVSPRAGTEIRIYHAENIVFRANLPRNLEGIAALAESAVETAHNNVVQLGLQGLLFNDPDLAKQAF